MAAPTGITPVELGRAARASALVKEARWSAAPAPGGAHLELTMQSGEVTSLDAASFAITVTAG